MDTAVSLVLHALLCPVVLLPLASTQATYHIRPTSDSPCPHEDCLTVSEYASQNWSYSNSDNLTLVFLPGEHVLNTSIVFQLLVNVTLVGNDSSLPNITSVIVCKETSAFHFNNVSTVEIKALAFKFCGSSNNRTPAMSIETAVPAISVVVVSNFQFMNCHMECNQLALSINKSIAQLRDNMFVNNSGIYGGAIAVYNSTIVFPGQNQFTGNSAVVGGAIIAYSSKLMVKGPTAFVGNTANIGGGGALYVLESIVHFKDNINFEQNQATSHGAGVHAVHSVVLFDGITAFINNSGGSVGEGGGVWASYSQLHFREHTTFESNYAKNGGGICATDQTDLYISGKIGFFGNTATFSGGGIDMYWSNLHFNGTGTYTYTTYFSNTAGEHGGAISCTNYSLVRLEGNYTMKENSATVIGGAISMTDYSEFSIDGKSDFIGNWASTGGGALNARGAFLRIGGESSFVNNTASFNGWCGGAILAFISSVQFRGLHTFSNNSARDGGALAVTYTEVGDFNLHLMPNASISFTDNYALKHGGAVFVLPFTEYTLCAPKATNRLLEKSCFIRFDEPFYLSKSPYKTITLSFTNANFVRMPDGFYGSHTYMHECLGHIVTKNNFAEEGGNIIYGAALRKCRVELTNQYPCS